MKGRIKSRFKLQKACVLGRAGGGIRVHRRGRVLPDRPEDRRRAARRKSRPASSTADSPAEADSTPPTSAFFFSIEDYAEYYIAQVILPEPIEYKVLTDGGFETVTDTVQDAQMVNLEQLASLSGLDPEGDLQLWSYKIAIAPENADGAHLHAGH